MDKLREEFEKKISHDYGDEALMKNSDGDYVAWLTEDLWDYWQASRAAIVVELPPINIPSGNDTLLKATVQMAVEVQTNKCAEAIRAAGLSIKGE